MKRLYTSPTLTCFGPAAELVQVAPTIVGTTNWATGVAQYASAIC